jgi:ribosome-associated protein
MKEFKLKEEYIELIRLLKYMRIAETGGHAKIMVDEGMVMLNGEVELRKRAKLRPGDIVEVDGQQIKIV